MIYQIYHGIFDKPWSTLIIMIVVINYDGNQTTFTSIMLISSGSVNRHQVLAEVCSLESKHHNCNT